MRILVVNHFGNGQVIDSDAIPRVGDKIDMFYEPFPTVTQVLFWPTKDRLAKLQADALDIKAIITVA